MSNLKVLLLNGSPRPNGNTAVALKEMEKVFNENGVDTEIVNVGNRDVRGCVACNGCATKGKCVFDDVVNEIAPKFEEADGLVVASPVYFASANATLIACLDRLFYSTGFDKTMKVGASVVCARRGGCSATFDELNKYFTIISSKPDEICEFIMNGLDRSATVYHGEGVYSHKDKKIILTVVDVRQAVLLQRFIDEVDPQAFLMVTKSSEVVGKGFMSYI